MTKKLVPLLAPRAARARRRGRPPRTRPSERVLYEDGPTNRYLMDGQWLFRLDPGNAGLSEGFQRQTSTEGWNPTTVPNAWNAGDESPESMRGTIGWYRKDFTLPSSSSRYDWILRFESVNYRSRVWINGKPSARTAAPTSRSSCASRARALNRGGTNRLVVRVENIRTQLRPAARRASRRTAVPDRRLVELRRDPARGLPAQGRPRRLQDRPGAARPAVPHVRGDGALPRDRPQLLGLARSASASPGASAASAFRFARARGRRRSASRRSPTSIRVGSPRLWSPERPSLYTSTSIAVRAGGTARRRLPRSRAASAR